MNLPVHEGYQRLIDLAAECHRQGRRTDLVGPQDIDLARLYCYAFRTHTIGSFHATRLAAESCRTQDGAARAHLLRAREQLEDLANQGMEPVPDDFRVVLSTLYRYDRGVRRVVDALDHAHLASGDAELEGIGKGFARVTGQITGCNGIHLTRDVEAPEQAAFIVPNLGITIVPLVYGDHHSWNLAHLSEGLLDVPMHRHRFGVEIHLGYQPLEGFMVLGECKAPVREGYAMPIPPMTRHGWVNTSGRVHHVPFIFGSLKHGGWGVFLDVEPQPKELDKLRTVDRASWRTGPTVFLDREIETMAGAAHSRRRILVPPSAMDRQGSGGLELGLARAAESGLVLPVDGFRMVSVVRGQGLARVGPVERPIRPHDHFGIPSGMTASLCQRGYEPLVVLDALIKGIADDGMSPAGRRG